MRSISRRERFSGGTPLGPLHCERGGAKHQQAEGWQENRIGRADAVAAHRGLFTD